MLHQNTFMKPCILAGYSDLKAEKDHYSSNPGNVPSRKGHLRVDERVGGTRKSPFETCDTAADAAAHEEQEA